jgi:two-component system chemotaxis response regulator CheY
MEGTQGMSGSRRGESNRKEQDFESRTDRRSTPITPLEATLTSMFSMNSGRENRYKRMSTRILIVDDSAPLRGMLRHLLEDHPEWEVCGEAANGFEAIEKYRILRPDLLVMDVSMPVMNGVDASLEILKLSPKTLILLCTSYLTGHLIEFAHQAGIRGAVSKDTMDLVVVGLEALLRGEEFSGPAN